MNESIDDNSELSKLVKVYEDLEIYNRIDYDALFPSKIQNKGEIEKIDIVDYHTYAYEGETLGGK